MLRAHRHFYIANDDIALAEYIPDEDDYANWDDWGDPAVERAYNGLRRDTFEEYRLREWHQRWRASVIRVKDGALVGWMGLSPDDKPDLAIRVFKPYRGLGYGTTAFTLAVEYCFNAFELDVIHAGCYRDNAASMRMLDKCGFVRYPLDDSCEPHYLTDEETVQLVYIYRRED